MTEARAQYEFIKSVEQGGKWVAMVADAHVLGEDGVASLRSASKMGAFNQVRVRAGVHFMTAEQLETRIPVMELNGMDRSVQNMQRALDVINQKNGLATPAVAHIQKPALA